jgi:hypothetical protein
MRIAIPLLSVIAVACSADSTHPSAQDTYDNFVTTYCQSVAACCADAGVSCDAHTCESQFARTVDGTESCSQDQVNACLDDIRASSCVNLTAGTWPASCSGC